MLKVLAGTILALQLALSAVAAATLVMLHGDGAFFVYAVSVGSPWLLKWRDIADRAAVYVLTVEPTVLLAQVFDLGPRAIAAANGFIFYAVPAVLFAIACVLVWRKNPRYLIFPVATYVLGASLGFGFPSELLIAPGFLWIALFLVLNGRVWSIGFVASMLGLLFVHELAVPCALVAGYLAITRLRAQETSGHARSMILAGVLLAFVAVLVAVLSQGGAGGATGNTIYVLDLRRVLNCPTLWLVSVVFAGALVLVRTWPALAARRYFLAGIVLALLSAPLLQLAFPGLNFEQGRYDSARTIIAVLMFALTLAFAATLKPQVPSPAETHRVPLTGLLALALAAAMSAASVFLYDWCGALRAVEYLTGPANAAAAPQPVDIRQPRALLTATQARLIARMEFDWVLPFESAVLADGRVPQRIVFDGAMDYAFYCRRAGLIVPSQSRIPAPVLGSVRDYACTHKPPPVDTIQSRFFGAIKRLLHR